MSDRHVAQDGVRDTRSDGELDGSHDFARTLAKAGKSQDLIIRCGDQHFKKSPGLRHRPGSQHGCHRDLAQTISNALLLCLRFVEPYMGKLRIGIEAGGHLSSRSRAPAAAQVVANDAEIVERYVCEQGATSAVAERPNTRSTGLQPLIHINVTPFRG